PTPTTIECASWFRWRDDRETVLIGCAPGDRLGVRDGLSCRTTNPRYRQRPAGLRPADQRWSAAAGDPARDCAALEDRRLPPEVPPARRFTGADPVDSPRRAKRQT